MADQNGTQVEAITADEIALYDRQIRLWGVKAQESLRKANVLLISMKALANEVAKNLVLAGINSLTIADHETVVESDFAAQFCISVDHISQNRAEASLPYFQRLNNRVRVTADTEDIRTKDPSYFQSFQLIIATDLDYPTLVAINDACRLANRPFYAGGTYGLYGFIFADLISHDYILKSEPSNIEIKEGRKPGSRHTIVSVSRKREDAKVVEIVEHRRTYTPITQANASELHTFLRKTRRRIKDVSPSLPSLRGLWEFQLKHSRNPSANSGDDVREWSRMALLHASELGIPNESMNSEFLRKFIHSLEEQFAPVTAMVGGILAQDAINVIQHVEAPINNFMFFDGNSYKVPVYALHPLLDEPHVNGGPVVATNGTKRAKTPEGAIELD